MSSGACYSPAVSDFFWCVLCPFSLEVHSALKVGMKVSEAQMWQLTHEREYAQMGDSGLKDQNLGREREKGVSEGPESFVTRS